MAARKVPQGLRCRQGAKATVIVTQITFALDDCFSLPEPNGESHQGCWYTSDETSVTEFEVTAVGLITRTWTVEGGKVMRTTDYDDGNAPSVEEESSMSSLDDALAEEKDGICKKIKTAMCK